MKILQKKMQFSTVELLLVLINFFKVKGKQHTVFLDLLGFLTNRYQLKNYARKRTQRKFFN